MEKLLKRIGQLFVLAFRSEEPPAPFLNFIEEEQIGGVVLFGENCRTYAVARENIRRINLRVSGIPPLIAIDQEGGPSCRLRGAPAEFKAPAAYGRQNDVEHFREDYSRAVVLLTSMGINLNLAPVADLFVNDRNTCLATRCFSDNPLRTAEFVRSSVAVAHSQGMLSCLKHFPGLGAAEIDPHEATATVDYDRLLWEQRERIPFAAGVEAGADLVMTTHLVARRIDSQIITASERVISDLLRDDLGFEGPVITDDLTMKGAEPLGDYGERAVAAFMAGHDLLLFCDDFEAGVEAFECFAGAVRAGDIPPERVRASLDRAAGIKLKLGRPVLR